MISHQLLGRELLSACAATRVCFRRRIELEVLAAVESPRPDARCLLTFPMLGTYVDIVPVFVGLPWFPVLRRIGRHWMNFFRRSGGTEAASVLARRNQRGRTGTQREHSGSRKT
ncbi:MAG: hypothetical protein ACRDIC_23440 [bacterium]